jgi:nucleoside-diphosphate-sugar epimerase
VLLSHVSRMLQSLEHMFSGYTQNVILGSVTIVSSHREICMGIELSSVTLVLQTQLLDPAVKGTINVLESCAKAKGVKRVVLTSSIGSVAYTPHRASGAVLDESSWSDVDSNRENQRWYPLSKFLAEKAAWDFAKEHDLEKNELHPGKTTQFPPNTSQASSPRVEPSRSRCLP